MKGIITCGGKGTRLLPSTVATNKQGLNVYGQPMVHFPITYLKNAGITDICVVFNRGNAHTFVELLNDGSHLGVNIAYRMQDEPLGIAHAISMCKNWAQGEDVCVVLGDNIFEDEQFLVEPVASFKHGATVFLKEIADEDMFETGWDGVKRAKFGIVELDGERVADVVEKPTHPKSPWAQIGAYILDKEVFTIISSLKPSARGQYEIADVTGHYIKNGLCQAVKVKGWWSDVGTHDALAETVAALYEIKHGKGSLQKALERRYWGPVGLRQVSWKVKTNQ